MSALQAPTDREEGIIFHGVSFFKGVWNVVEEDLCDAVLHFFEFCYLPHGVNTTAIILIPKRMEDFQPISWCNVIYKCNYKIRAWLPNFIIGINLSLFLGGVLLVILCFVKSWLGYHLNSGNPRCAMMIFRRLMILLIGTFCLACCLLLAPLAVC